MWCTWLHTIKSVQRDAQYLAFRSKKLCNRDSNYFDYAGVLFLIFSPNPAHCARGYVSALQVIIGRSLCADWFVRYEEIRLELFLELLIVLPSMSFRLPKTTDEMSEMQSQPSVLSAGGRLQLLHSPQWRDTCCHSWRPVSPVAAGNVLLPATTTACRFLQKISQMCLFV